MKTATKNDKPDWYDRPADVIGVNVCRLSGKLPNDGCGSVMSYNDDYGMYETKSMIYTDYFVKGTQPTTVCPLHPSTALIVGDAGNIRSESGAPHAGIPVGTMGPVPAQPPGISGGTVPPPPEKDKTEKEKTDKEKKKRGFWGRVFGRGGG
jgi:penicillin-binding protein 1A